MESGEVRLRAELATMGAESGSLVQLMPLTVGSRLGHYDVTALIGEGGMGQVYQATDTKLNRQVALKILPEAGTDGQRHSWSCC